MSCQHQARPGVRAPSASHPTTDGATVGEADAAVADSARAGEVDAASLDVRPPTAVASGGTSGTQSGWLVAIVCAGAAIAGAFADVAPGGHRVADRLVTGAFLACLAAAGTVARRWTRVVPAVVGYALAANVPGLLLAAAAVLLVMLERLVERRDPVLRRFVGALGAALGGLALLRLHDFGVHGISALITAAAIAPMLLSAVRGSGPRTRRRVRWVAVTVGGATLLVVLAYGALLMACRSGLDRGVERLDQAAAAAREGDDALAERRFAQAAAAFGGVDDLLGGWWTTPVRSLPVVGHNARAVGGMAGLAADLADDAARTAARVDTDRLSVTGGRLDLGAVRELQAPFEDVVAALDGADRRLAAIESPWLVGPVADQVARLRDEVTRTQPDARLAAHAVRVLPEMFGGDGESRWLVAFVTPVEARGRSGFLGNYAELTAVDGAVEMTRFGRTSDLEDGGIPGRERTLTGPDDFLAQWGEFDPTTTWVNITMSPHFPSVGQVMAELYPQSGGQPVDGVIAVDPGGLAALLELTGPIRVPGLADALTADTAERFLLLDQYVELPDTDARADVLEAFARTVFEELTSRSLPGPAVVADALADPVRQGRIQLYAVDPDHQRLFAELGAAGALPPVDGDALAVVNNNASGNKIDVFLSRDIAYRVRWDPSSGDLAATARVTLRNDAPTAGLPDYVIGSAIRTRGGDLPLGANRTYLSVYTPWQLVDATLDGDATGLHEGRERGRNVYSIVVDVPPEGGTRTVELELRGHMPADADGGYRLDVATQPLVEPDRFDLTVEVDGDDRLSAEPPVVLQGRTAGATTRLVDLVTTFRLAVGR